MTKFVNLGGIPKVIEKKKTVFNGFIDADKVYNFDNTPKPTDYDVVVFIGHDSTYGDVFKAYNDNPYNFTLFFGIKGDEFEDNEE